MSRELTARSPDLARLVADGYLLRVIDDALLVVEGVPYVTTARTVDHASLVMVLTLRGDVATKPADHVAYWTGSTPCTAEGVSLSDKLGAGGSGSVGPFSPVLMFSAKADYQDYQHKVETYVEYLEREARKVQPGATARQANGDG